MHEYTVRDLILSAGAIERDAVVGVVEVAEVAEQSPPIVEVVERLRTETEIADAVDFSAFLRRHGRVGVFSEFTYRPFGKTSTVVGTIVRSEAADGTVDSYEVRFGGPAKLAEANRCFAVASHSTARKALVAARVYATAQIVERVLALAAAIVKRVQNIADPDAPPPGPTARRVRRIQRFR